MLNLALKPILRSQYINALEKDCFKSIFLWGSVEYLMIDNYLKLHKNMIKNIVNSLFEKFLALNKIKLEKSLEKFIVTERKFQFGFVG